MIISVLLLILPAAAGCGGGSETETPTSNTFLELLTLVPADYTSSQPFNFLRLTDLASYFQDFDITFTNFEELTEKIKANNIHLLFVVASAHITGGGRFAQTSTIQDKYVGYDISNIDAEIVFGDPPFEEVAAIGRFDPQATKNALSNQSDWPDWAKSAYTTEEYHGITIHSWGSGFETHVTTRLLPPHIDELGRAMPLAVTESHLFYAPSVEAVKIMIDASKNTYTSLADLPEYAAIANGLADLKAYTAVAGDASQANDPLLQRNTQLTDEEKAQLIKNAGVILKKFLTFGCGLGSDEKGFYTAIVIYHENPDFALQNVSLLKQHIENDSSIFTHENWSKVITEADIWAKGNTLMAKLYSDSPMFWESLAYDTLLLHEE
jgi:hypothetical protein